MSHCLDCHTSPDRLGNGHINTAAFLTGGNVYGTPPPLQPVLGTVRVTSANLKGAVNGFYAERPSFRLFRNIMTTGTHADENPPRPLGFPMNLVAANLANLLEDDLRAVYEYEKRAPAITGVNDRKIQDYARYCTADGDCQAGENCATHECQGGACAADSDCSSCQTCVAEACVAPAPDDPCVVNAF
jgi:hypothetical protein